MKKIGVLTGGGDCPGLNAVITGVVRKAVANGWEVVGIKEGWRGMLEQITEPLTAERVENLQGLGGTILKSSRTNPCKSPELMDKVIEKRSFQKTA